MVFVDYVDDGDLPLLYKMAEVFAYPSLYEGFGLPVAEAMSCGTPVLVSEDGALAEVVGEAALVVDARSVESIAGRHFALDWRCRLEAQAERSGPGKSRSVYMGDSRRTGAAGVREAAV